VEFQYVIDLVTSSMVNQIIEEQGFKGERWFVETHKPDGTRKTETQLPTEPDYGQTRQIVTHILQGKANPTEGVFK
jgi:hypothetical protein